MSIYSINQLEQLTGIKAHTIRIWEQRYQLLKPERTDSNIRMYNDEELRKLLNTSLLINNGHKISKIANYSEKKISEIINEMISSQKSSDIFSELIINQLISSGLVFNEINFEKGFSSAILKLGLKDTYIKILYPLFVKMGMMWTSLEISPGQEHFITNLIRQKLFSAIDKLPIPSGSKKKWLLFLPEEENHESGLLFANFILKQANQSIVYLGPNVPFESLKTAIQFNKPTHLLFFIVKRQQTEMLQKFITGVRKDFKNVTIVISGNKESFAGIEPVKRLHFVTSVSHFYNLIK